MTRAPFEQANTFGGWPPKRSMMGDNMSHHFRSLGGGAPACKSSPTELSRDLNGSLAVGCAQEWPLIGIMRLIDDERNFLDNRCQGPFGGAAIRVSTN
jgi:hypothetical protein